MCLPWYSPDHKGYRCYDLTSRRVLISRHVVIDESVFPFSTTTTPASTSELDLSFVFPINPVAEPPLPVFPVGTAMPPVARDTSGPLPCPGPEGSPSGPAPAHDTGPGSTPPTLAPPARFAQPVRVYQRRATVVGLEPATPTPPARFAQPVCVYQRRARLAPLPLPGSLTVDLLLHFSLVPLLCSSPYTSPSFHLIVPGTSSQINLDLDPC